MKKINLRKFIIVFIFIVIDKGLHADAFKDIVDLYLRSFSKDNAEDNDKLIPLKVLSKSSKDTSVASIRPPKLSERVIRELIFNTILDKTYIVKDYLSSKQKILNKYIYGDLRIFYGTTTDPSHNLFNHIKRTKTLVGECILATMLATPSKDVEEIERRQEIIVAFLNTDKEFENLNNILSKYEKIESSLLSFYTANDPLYSKTWLDFMHQYYYYGIGNDSNKDAYALEFKKRLRMDFWNIFYEFTYPIYWNSLAAFLTNMFPLESRQLEMFNSSPYRSAPFSGLAYKWKYNIWNIESTSGKLSSHFSQVSFTIGFVGNLLFESAYIYYFWRAVKLCSEHTQVFANLAMRMRDVQIFFQTLIELDNVISRSAELNKKYGPKIKHVRALIARKDDGTELGNLVKYMLEMPLNRKWQYFLNNTGKLLASYALLAEHIDHLLNAIAEVGELDAIFSVVKLYKEAKDYSPENCYTFVKFLPLEDNITPILTIEEMWHPLIDSKKAVTNSVSMNEKLRTIILTGPNAGGKSTYIANIALCVLMGQAFGIVPAKSVTLTPFSKISSYIDVSDDIIEGTSLFKAEVRRAQEHIQMLVGLRSHEFALTLFDEPFSGTNPTEGAAAEYSILLSLARFRTSFTIVATHFPLVMLLEDRHPEKAFANYKVFINEKSGKLNYIYKVLKGKSTQAIAIRILEEEGFDVSLLQRAKDIIKNPSKYVAKFE